MHTNKKINQINGYVFQGFVCQESQQLDAQIVTEFEAGCQFYSDWSEQIWKIVVTQDLLFRSIFFALNSHLNIELSTSQLPSTLIKKYQIKKTKRYNIEGLQKIKQTQQKRTITAFQFQGKFYSSNNIPQKQLTSQQKSSKIFQKYSNALQIIDNKVFGCFKMSSFNNARTPIFTSQKPSQKSESNNSSNSLSNITIRTVLIVLNIVAKLQYEQLSCMKFFITDIKQKGLKILVILTHIDKLNKMKQNDKLTLIEERIEYLKKELDIKDRDDFICIENYQEVSGSGNGPNGNSGMYHQKNPQKSAKHVNSNPQSSLQNNYHNIQHKNYSQVPSNSFHIHTNRSFHHLQRQPNPMSQNNSSIINPHLYPKQPSFQKVKLKQNYPRNNHYYQGQSNSFVIKKYSGNKNTISATKYSSNNGSHQNSFILQIPQISSNKSSRNVVNQGDDFYSIQFSTQKSLPIDTPQKSKEIKEEYSIQRYKNQPSDLNSHYRSNNTNHSNHYDHPGTQFYQNSNQNYSQQQNHPPNMSLPLPIKNNQQINYYSLKLLMKIIKQNEKYVAKELKGRKMIKWFCG